MQINSRDLQLLDDSYHGIVYTERFGKGAYITKATAQLMRDLGSIQAPMNSFLLNVGLETLHLRMPSLQKCYKGGNIPSEQIKVAWLTVRC